MKNKLKMILALPLSLMIIQAKELSSIPINIEPSINNKIEIKEHLHLNREEALKSEHAQIRETIRALKWKKKVLKAKFELEKLKYTCQNYNEEFNYQVELEQLENDAKLVEIKTDKILSEMSLKKAVWELKTEKLESEIKTFEIAQERSFYADRKPEYLDNPLREDNTLVISDRRIPLNGLVTYSMAYKITKKINYFNNKDRKKPIFIVIDSSPGGSVMGGYQIIKAVESSKAPVYVVLKSFAASMTAVLVAVADNSFAYSHATILHHQPSSYLSGSSNLTQQKESYKNLEKWWKYLGTPVAQKMGIELEEFKRQMYVHSSEGDWAEFAVDAVKLHWVNHIVREIEDTSVLKDEFQLAKTMRERKGSESRLYKRDNKEEIDKDGKTFVYLPHLSPTDVYFLYSPDGYYKVR